MKSRKREEEKERKINREKEREVRVTNGRITGNGMMEGGRGEVDRGR